MHTSGGRPRHGHMCSDNVVSHTRAVSPGRHARTGQRHGDIRNTGVHECARQKSIWKMVGAIGKHRCDSTRGCRQHGGENARLAPFVLESQESKGLCKVGVVVAHTQFPTRGGELIWCWRVVAGRMQAGGESRNSDYVIWDYVIRGNAESAPQSDTISAAPN